MEAQPALLIRSHRRVIAAIFTVVFVLLATFGVRAAMGVEGTYIYFVTMLQMLVLAAIMTPYVLTVVFLDE